MPTEPSTGVAKSPATASPGAGRAPSLDLLAYTYAMDLTAEPYQALSLARDLLKKVVRSGLKSPFSDQLLRRLALGEWARLDRPRPMRVESSDPKESAILLFFLEYWGVTYEDLSVTLQITEERSRHLVHKARIELITTKHRLPIPRSGCRRTRELLSDYHDALLAEPVAAEVAEHLQTCRECPVLSDHLVVLLRAPQHALLLPPSGLKDGDVARPLMTNLGVSRNKRVGGIALLVLGVAMGAVQLIPSWNAAAAAQVDRLSAFSSRWRGRAQRLMEDLKVLRALAMGTVEGRTEELSQTIDDYVNADPAAENASQKNKPAPDAVLDSRDPKTEPKDPKIESSGTPSPRTQPSEAPKPGGTPKPQDP